MDNIRVLMEFFFTYICSFPPLLSFELCFRKGTSFLGGITNKKLHPLTGGAFVYL